jgi:hypothetical protein
MRRAGRAPGTSRRAWSGIAGWSFEFSSAHRESPALAGLSHIRTAPGQRGRPVWPAQALIAERAHRLRRDRSHPQPTCERLGALQQVDRPLFVSGSAASQQRAGEVEQAARDPRRCLCATVGKQRVLVMSDRHAAAAERNGRPCEEPR